MLSSLFLTLAAAGLALAAPSVSPNKRFLNCMNPVSGLSTGDCNSLSQKGLAFQGVNSHTPNDFIWIGDQGPFRFHFKNTANIPQTLVLWHFAANMEGDDKYNAHFLTKAENPAAQITYSLAAGEGITISMGHGISGAYSWVNEGIGFVEPGLIDNTWGEFTTGNGGAGTGTTNVSHLASANGRPLTIKTPTCIADSNRCVFKCKYGLKQCGALGTVVLENCTEDVNPGSGTGHNGDPKAPEGGCFGFDDEGDIQVLLG